MKLDVIIDEIIKEKESKYFYKSGTNSITKEKRDDILNKNKCKIIVQKAVQNITNNKSTDDLNIGKRKIDGRTVHFSKDLYTDIILSFMQKRLNRYFRVNPQNRKETIKCVINYMEGHNNFSILKLDIKDFFNSINKKAIEGIVSEVCYDKQLVSMLSKYLNLEVSTLMRNKEIEGVGAGLSISNVLAEIIGEKIDYKVKKKLYEQNYRFEYYRYVDDILILGYFNASNSKNIMKIISDSIEEFELVIHSAKNKYKFIDVFDSTTSEFIYLGYKFKYDASSKKLSLGISQKKIDVFKNRMQAIESLYLSDNNIFLFNERLEYYSSINIIRFSKYRYKSFGFVESYYEFFYIFKQENILKKKCKKTFGTSWESKFNGKKKKNFRFICDEDSVNELSSIYNDTVKNYFDNTTFREKYVVRKINPLLYFNKRRIFINNHNYINRFKLSRKIKLMESKYLPKNKKYNVVLRDYLKIVKIKK